MVYGKVLKNHFNIIIFKYILLNYDIIKFVTNLLVRLAMFLKIKNKITSKASKIISFFDKSLKRKFLLYQIIFLGVPFFVIFYSLSYYFLDDKKNEKMLFIEQSNNSAATNIDNYINNLIELTKQPLYDNRITSTLIDNRKRLEQKKSPYINKPYTIFESRKTGISTDFNYNESVNLLRIIDRLLPFNQNIYSVFIFNYYGCGTSRFKDNSLIRPYNARENIWFYDTLAKNGSAYIIRTDLWLNDYIEKTHGTKYVFGISRAIKDSFSLSDLGMITIFSDIKIFEDILSNSKSFKDDRFVIVDDGYIIYDNNDIYNIAKI